MSASKPKYLGQMHTISYIPHAALVSRFVLMVVVTEMLANPMGNVP